MSLPSSAISTERGASRAKATATTASPSVALEGRAGGEVSVSWARPGESSPSISARANTVSTQVGPTIQALGANRATASATGRPAAVSPTALAVG